MRNMVKILGIIALVAVVIGFTLIGCSDGGGGPTPPASDPALTGSVTISGTAEVGTTLTAVTTSLGGSGTISYQWKRNPATGTAVNIGTGGTYIVVSADVGFTITVTVTRAGYTGSKTSEPTAVVTDPSLPALTGIVTISGNAEVGQTLTAVTTSLQGSGTINYQWKRNSSGGTATVTGTNSGTYQVVSADVGSTITVTVTRTGNSSSVTSDPTTAVPDPSLPALTGTVTISGTAEVGETLTAVTTALQGSGTISYQWKRNPSTGAADNVGTNSSTYEVAVADIGSTISVTVTRSGNSGSRESAATAVVPVLTGTVNITITQERDVLIDDPRIVDGVLTLSRSDEVTLTIANAQDYDTIGWRVQNTGITGTGDTFVLYAGNPVYFSGKLYFITVEAFKNGIPYDFTISFKVEE